MAIETPLDFFSNPISCMFAFVEVSITGWVRYCLLVEARLHSFAWSVFEPIEK